MKEATVPAARVSKCLALMESLVKEFEELNNIKKTSETPIQTTVDSVIYFTTHFPINTNTKKISIIVSTKAGPTGKIYANISVNMFTFPAIDTYKSVLFHITQADNEVTESGVRRVITAKELRKTYFKIHISAWLRIVNVFETEIKKNSKIDYKIVSSAASGSHVLTATLSRNWNIDRTIRISLNTHPETNDSDFKLNFNTERGVTGSKIIPFTRLEPTLTAHMNTSQWKPWGACYEQQHQRLAEMLRDN